MTSPKLCADCGCELECVKHGCAKKYAAARDAVLEEAARIADDHEDHWRGRQRGSSYNIERKDEAGNIAAAIRALKSTAPQAAMPVQPAITAEHPDKPAESASCVVPKDDLPLRCKSVDGALDMRVGVKVLAFAAERCPDFWNGEDGLPGCRITDPIKFAKEVERELNRESEDGSTRLSRMLDEAIAEAINQGAEGVEEILLSERNGE